MINTQETNKTGNKNLNLGVMTEGGKHNDQRKKQE